MRLFKAPLILLSLVVLASCLPLTGPAFVVKVDRTDERFAKIQEKIIKDLPTSKADQQVKDKIIQAEHKLAARMEVLTMEADAVMEADTQGVPADGEASLTEAIHELQQLTEMVKVL